MDWSPDGRTLMTATTAPRMRVNNGIQLFRQGETTRQAWPHFSSETHCSLANFVRCWLGLHFLSCRNLESKTQPTQRLQERCAQSPYMVSGCRYTGDTVHEQKYPVLLEARWRPAPSGNFDDRPSSPRKGGSVASNASAAPIRAAGYVPPHVRSSGGNSPSSGPANGIQ